MYCNQNPIIIYVITGVTLGIATYILHQNVSITDVFYKMIMWPYLLWETFSDWEWWENMKKLGLATFVKAYLLIGATLFLGLWLFTGGC